MLQYPFDSEYLLKKKKTIKKQLLTQIAASGEIPLQKRIAILGGSTTYNVRLMLELFLLDYGILPEFYESEYGQYWEDAMFPNEELERFRPDLIYVHTSSRNLTEFPELTDTKAAIEEKLERQYTHFEQMWDRLRSVYHCPVIQNNVERPYYRLLGNKDVSDLHGKTNFTERFNQRMYEYARDREDFYINDLAWLQAEYGIKKWSDPFYWHMYKYALAVPAIPDLAFSIARIIKAIYGKNKKALVLDLDNTLWGGVVGDDGAENLAIGPEVPMGQVYSEIQSYIKEQKQLGILLTVASKNEYENAMEGLKHPDGVLRPEDFLVIAANWEPKSENLKKIAGELQILPDSLVFVDDNPAERELVKAQLPKAAVPDFSRAEETIGILDRNGFFEAVTWSEEDAERNERYKENSRRKELEGKYKDYREYLKDLDMKGEIRPFAPVYMARIAQLTNKSNQFNLTTRRYTQSEIEAKAADDSYLCLYGRLSDRFGDNGVVSVVIGRQEKKELHIELWIMSCRVLKRDMEYAMMDALVERSRKKGVEKLVGYYYPTPKNAMVKSFYKLQGFTCAEQDEKENSRWEFVIPTNYTPKNTVIQLESV